MSQKETHRFNTYSSKKKEKKKFEVDKPKSGQDLVNSDRKNDERLRTCLQQWRASSTFLPDNSDIEEFVVF